MEGTGLREWPRLLLLLLCVSGFEAVGEKEEEECLIEGKNLTVICPYNIMKYSLSRKAWQRVGSQGPPETLVSTETGNTGLNRAQAGRFLLEDYTTDAIVKVTMAELQKQDVGLYQCVVDLSPREPIILHQRIRLIQCDGMREAKPPPVLVIVLACGFILNKGLVFSVLFVLVWKTWASGEAAS
ncbi:triggering receptor expressed on myeloid cells 3-like isoform X2 [Choloepus didactylus]|uniref:triggering receptor expressed on myeloid cells 3-like isoform X2 n=1 Tax=Choloepus didactylus TaxID=27675 RepID=UPI00189F2D12|nr:triggering receptor expressed on myeloid cells 3-like isoform X2 [Choloepus didactylus]